MAKKPSRARRKQIRERHDRAQAHGLPGRALERPSKPAPSHGYEQRRARDAEPDSEPASVPAPATPPSALDRLKQLPLAAKLGAVVVAVLVVIGIVASLRKP